MLNPFLHLFFNKNLYLRMCACSFVCVCVSVCVCLTVHKGHKMYLLQCPHHGAKNSTNHTASPSITSLSKLSSVSSTTSLVLPPPPPPPPPLWRTHAETAFISQSAVTFHQSDSRFGSADRWTGGPLCTVMPDLSVCVLFMR